MPPAFGIRRRNAGSFSNLHPPLTAMRALYWDDLNPHLKLVSSGLPGKISCVMVAQLLPQDWN
jgi:hypothetical protein